MFGITEINSFINIETLFDKNHERNISSLETVYKQPWLLREKILKVSKGILDNNQIISGKRVLLKPNWVTHDRNENDEICLRTNDNLLLALVDIILDCTPAMITIGDAPIQYCSWDNLLRHDFTSSIKELSDSHSIPVVIKDFRRFTIDPKEGNSFNEHNDISNYIIFELGQNSFLEPISSIQNSFRVTNYDPDRLAKAHTMGKHKYCITKELFDADVVISVPKIKTHQKTGITGAIKNLVGLNGDKNYLPHHRVGGTGFGGDCYPGKNIFRRISEYFLDCANKKQGENIYWFWVYLSKIMWKLSFPENVHHLEAGWYGNDTSWRMVMDLNKIAIYGKKDGTISKTPQRELYSLCDGIVGGQGNGPLQPEPLPLGIISFSNHSALTDVAMSFMMGFDFNKIPLVRESINYFPNINPRLKFNSKTIEFNDLFQHSINTIPPPGWIGHIEYDQ